MAQQMRVDSLGDLRFLSRLLDNLLQAPRRISPVTITLKEISPLAISQMRSQLLRQFRQNGYVTALAAFALVNEEHLLLEEEILNAKTGKLGDPRASH